MIYLLVNLLHAIDIQFPDNIFALLLEMIILAI
jgi:hypothetical protein